MVAEPLERSVLSYMHHGFIVLDANIDAASAVRQIHGKKAEIIIVKQQKDGKKFIARPSHKLRIEKKIRLSLSCF